MRYQLSHKTSYAYDDDVTDSLGIAYLVPRSLPWQQVLSHDVEVDPAPADATQDVDYYGNTATYFQITERHRDLTIIGRSEVDVVAPRHDDATLQRPWEQSVPASRADAPTAWQAAEFTIASPLVELTAEAHDYAAASLRPGRAVGDALTDLMHRIHADFTYEQGATTVTTTVDDVFEKKAGVCQDFAHLTLSCLRSHGLAARYVSGYLATQPPAGKDRVLGADASHAWVACWLPDGDWLAIDPTNDQWAGDRYVTVAWGRDYGDVPPVKGVIFTEAKKSTMTVEVDVAPVI